ncbi:uncharacterized protein LOC133331793, partial [Musca vetustissima]|uniref:uncharacterized protein LOC133331793 n=1 Tax=Musca vetustissima TaxID=27455 RepID=UPI002AB751B4
MACLYEGCTITSTTERLITCWLCDKHAHFKCAGFNGRLFDKISDRNNGLRWACGTYEVDFYRLFKEAKLEMVALKRGVDSVYSRLENFEKMFNNFEFADGSPKRKKSLVVAQGDNLIALNSPVVVPPRNNSNPSPCGNHLALPALHSNSGSAAITLNLRDSCSSPIETSNSSAPNVLSRPPIIPPIVVNTPSPIPTQPSIPLNEPSTSNNELIVVAPRKTVFISRLHANTTVENIRSYIGTKLKDIN